MRNYQYSKLVEKLTPKSPLKKDLINAFISIEDKNFYSHNGINLKRMGGALLSNLKSNSISEGASTITQQLARNLFLSNEKTYKRKIEEISIAIALESGASAFGNV